MICTYLRSSSYNQYAFCEQSYFITYVLGHQQLSGKRADLGTICHKVMEVLAVAKKYQQSNPTHTLIEFEDDALGKITIPTNEFHSDELINELFERSFTYYSNRSPHNKFTKAEKKETLQLCFDAVQYNHGQFDPRRQNIVDAEPHFDIPIEEDWARYKYTMPDGKEVEGQLAIKGTIDLVTESSPGIIEVIDYKTGRRLDWATGEEKTYDKLCSDPQLLLYNYAISKLYPQYDQSILTIFFIRDGGPFSMCFDKVDHTRFLGMLRKRFEDIKANTSPRPLSQDRSSWKCTRLCHFYKNNWPGTDKTMCHHVEDTIKLYGIDHAVKTCSKTGFDIGYYSAPG